MNILANDAGLDGHDQLAALMSANIHPPIGETLEFVLIELERGRVVFEGSPTRKVFNPIGSVHGGYAATLLDSACGCAVHSSLPAGARLHHARAESRLSSRLERPKRACARGGQAGYPPPARGFFRSAARRCPGTIVRLCDLNAAGIPD